MSYQDILKEMRQETSAYRQRTDKDSESAKEQFIKILALNRSLKVLESSVQTSSIGGGNYKSKL